MNMSRKLLGTVVVSSALLSSSIVGMANNSSDDIDTVDMQLGLKANEGGKSVDLSIHNASMSNAFHLSLKLGGDVEYKSIEFNEVIKANGLANVEYDEASKVIDIVVTSDVDLVKGGVLDIGTLIVEGADGVEYTVNDNVVSGKPTITMVTPTYDEVGDFDLEEVGDTAITIGEKDDAENGGGDTEEPPIEPPTDGDNGDTEEPPTEPPTDGDNGSDGGDGGDINKPPTGGNIGSIEIPDGVVVEEGSDGVKILEPTTESQLNSLISEILKKDSDAKIVDVKEDSMYYMYRIKYKNTTTRATSSAYIDIKVAKSIKPTEGLPGIDVEKPNGGGGSNGGGDSIVVRPETKVVKLIGNKRYETAVKISQEGWKDGAKTVVIVNGNDRHLVDSLSASPLASVKDAPILLSDNGVLPKETLDELKRLNPTNVYVIGGEGAMPNSVVEGVKNAIKGVNVNRLGGNTRFDTSLSIAKEIDKTNDISKIYVSGGFGEVDSLSIAPVAGRDKAPIILTNVDGLNSATYDFIKSEDVKDGYFIGGTTRISDKAVEQINEVVSKDISGNRVAGVNRKDTNAKVIEKFYSREDLGSAVITKDIVIVDALTVGSLASKRDMPVIIGEDSLSAEQERVLSKKRASKIYQAGGGTKDTVINRLKELLNNRK